MSKRSISRWISPGGPPMLETDGRQAMSIVDVAIEDIERRMNEEHAIIADAKQALVFLQQEKDQILKEAAEAAAAKAARDEAQRFDVVD
jgi:hypothetical protein